MVLRLRKFGFSILVEGRFLDRSVNRQTPICSLVVGMRTQWRKIQEDAVEGFRILQGEAQSLFKRTLVATERARMRRNMDKLEEALQEKYQEVGKKIYQYFTAGEGLLTERDFREQFGEIEQLQAERQRLMEEMNASSKLQD